MDVLMLISILVALCAVFSYINIRFLKLPSAIGVMLISLIFSLVIMAESKISNTFYHQIEAMVRSINFSQTLLNIMLGFLLFAGSLRINISELKKQRVPVLSFSTLSVAISIFFFGSIMWWIFRLFEYPVDFIYCLWFGSLVSPTDPIAVIGILKKSNIRHSQTCESFLS